MTDPDADFIAAASSSIRAAYPDIDWEQPEYRQLLQNMVDVALNISTYTTLAEATGFQLMQKVHIDSETGKPADGIYIVDDGADGEVRRLQGLPDPEPLVLFLTPDGDSLTYEEANARHEESSGD
jgi:hypothetical protein